MGGAYTLDESGSRPVLWLAGEGTDGEKMVCVEDRGETLVVRGDNYLNRDASAITFVSWLSPAFAGP